MSLNLHELNKYGIILLYIKKKKNKQWSSKPRHVSIVSIKYTQDTVKNSSLRMEKCTSSLMEKWTDSSSITLKVLSLHGLRPGEDSTRKDARKRLRRRGKRESNAFRRAILVCKWRNWSGSRTKSRPIDRKWWTRRLSKLRIAKRKSSISKCPKNSHKSRKISKKMLRKGGERDETFFFINYKLSC